MGDIDWLERWQDDRIGFHQQKINSRLTRLWPSLQLSKKSGVFVPLCGKTLDMVWIRNQGFKVIGCELSEIACRDFFLENQIEFSSDSAEKFQKYSGDGVSLLQGDIFDMTAEMLTSVSGVFDRAALIALPAETRIRYASHLASILPLDAKILLISMEYDQDKMQGPPFSVSESEVKNLFQPHFNVEVISHSSGPDIVGNLKERGLDTLDEKVYLMTSS